MKAVLSPEQMKICDALAAQKDGMSSQVLMERAAKAAMEVLLERLTPERVWVFCGSGNNGGDGYALARFLLPHVPSVRVFAVMPAEKMTVECRRQAELFRNCGGRVDEQWPVEQAGRETVIVDAIFGIGLDRAPAGRAEQAVLAINRASAAGCKVLSLDVPSGVDAETGQVPGHAVRADITVTFGQYKTGLLLFPAADFVGELVLRDIGIPVASPAVTPTCFAPEVGDIAPAYPRPAYSNKSFYGNLLCVVGSDGMSGAALLCARAAYRTGAGIVRVLTPACNRVILQSALPEAIVVTYGDEGSLSAVGEKDVLDRSSAVVMGCGLSRSRTALHLLTEILRGCAERSLPLVLDADALNLLAENPDLWALVPSGTVLTPHPGEMARLTGRAVADIVRDLPGSARSLARDRGVICVLKDAATVVAAPDGTVYFPLRGNAGMAVGGSGDVLAGMIGATLAERRDTDPGRAELCALAVCLHASAGNSAAQKRHLRSIMATDIVENIWDFMC